jgi:hypothetical protein
VNVLSKNPSQNSSKLPKSHHPIQPKLITLTRFASPVSMNCNNIDEKLSSNGVWITKADVVKFVPINDLWLHWTSTI